LAAAKNGIRVTNFVPGGMKSEHFWAGNPKSIETYMDPMKVAGVVKGILYSDPSLCPAEVVVERM
jgi:hypothetical protein